MTTRLAGKVALITGAARGIGRAQAVRFAQEGADIIGLDVCGPVETVSVPASTPAGLQETARLVQQAGARMYADVVDVRDLDGLRAATDRGWRGSVVWMWCAPMRGSPLGDRRSNSAKNLGAQCLTST